MNNKKLNEQIVVAIRNEKLSDIKKLLKEGADPNHVFKIDDREFSLLHMAIFYEDMPYVKLLVESGADINKLSYVNGKKNKLSYENSTCYFEIYKMFFENNKQFLNYK